MSSPPTREGQAPINDTQGILMAETEMYFLTQSNCEILVPDCDFTLALQVDVSTTPEDDPPTSPTLEAKTPERTFEMAHAPRTPKGQRTSPSMGLQPLKRRRLYNYETMPWTNTENKATVGRRVYRKWMANKPYLIAKPSSCRGYSIKNNKKSNRRSR
ncbi:Hypothetical predicted protein [Pelobates cultripes]|uniref:Uncharacterized protein n=1 Tax=Pelobates cultripes TaxID=61616 RepID=A0AAD1WJG4_PELCU|nr:Hypothetical predicted protein [Pelobates cultripes]